MVEYVLASLKRNGLHCRRHGSDDREIFVCCPFCIHRGTTRDTRYRLGVNVGTGLGHCFNCGFRGKNVLAKLSAAPPDGWAARAVMGTPEPKAPELPPSLPKDFTRLAKHGGFWMDKAREYLKGRGVGPSDAKHYEVGLSLSGEASHRIVVPVRSKSRKLMGWSGRTITEATPKWKHSVGLRAPYVANWVKVDSDAILVEGIFDAWAVAKLTQYSATVMALLGSRMTMAKYKAIKKCRHVTLWLDPDEAGITATARIGAELANRGHRVWHVASADDPATAALKDPGEAERDLWNRAPWKSSDDMLAYAMMVA